MWRDEAVRLSEVVESVQAQMPAPLAALLGAGLVGLVFASGNNDDEPLLPD